MPGFKRKWEAVIGTDAIILEVIDLLFSKVPACEMENRRLCNDASAMRGELERLRAESDACLALGLGSPRGPGSNAD
jgi:hypothetical protein